jgi:undecaprenyl-phosphate 4-deoxy-4-formamido-L-arabinose transferase
MTKVSVAIPCYKSALTIPAVVDELRAVFATREEYDYEIILVNDYPDDGTFDVISSLCAGDPKIIGVNLSRNFGQTTAKMAALPYVTGDVLVYMDDDGQHPADQIFLLVDKVLEGYDMVYARFPHKKHNVFKRFASWLNARVLELNGTKPRDITLSSYHAMSRTAVEALKKYRSPFPSMAGYLFHVVRRYANVDMEHRARLAGKSNYTLRKMLRLWLTTFTNFSTVPLRLAAFLGVACALVGGAAGLIVVIRKLINPAIAAGYTSSIALQLFIGGIIMMILGLSGEYIGRIYMTVSNMPQYEIRQVLNADEKEDELCGQ